MASRLRRSALLLIVGVLPLAAAPVSANPPRAGFGGNEQQEHSVSTRDAGVDVSMSYVIVGGEIHARPGRTTPTGPGGCEMTVERIPALEAIPITDEWVEGAIDIRITCGPDGRNRDIWATIPDADAAARDEARRYAERVLAPETTIGTSPPASILVGLPTWFWLDGWDGTTRTTTVTAPWGDTLDLQLTLEHLTWDFGDGSDPRQGGIGQPYPAESDIQHTYTHRSTSRAEPDAAYPLAAQLTIAVTYHYDGQGPIAVDPIDLTIEQPITVHQLQAVIRH